MFEDVFSALGVAHCVHLIFMKTLFSYFSIFSVMYNFIYYTIIAKTFPHTLLQFNRQLTQTHPNSYCYWIFY